MMTGEYYKSIRRVQKLTVLSNRTMEYAPVEDVFCPPLHRINQVVRHRAIYADQPLPPVAPILLKYSNPPEDLVVKARSKLEDLIAEANVKKGIVNSSLKPLYIFTNVREVPPKAKGRREKGAKPEPISGLDIDALLNQPQNKRKKIDSENAIPEFKQMVEYANEESEIESAAKQMGTIIRSLITNSLGDSGYDRAIENLGVFRDTMVKWEMPALYNSFLKDLKNRLLSGELGGDRRELWWQMKGAKASLGLIDQSLSEPSNITPEEAAEVCDIFSTHLFSPLLIISLVLQEVMLVMTFKFHNTVRHVRESGAFACRK